jgi:hypothetical protein
MPGKDDQRAVIAKRVGVKRSVDVPGARMDDLQS